YGKTTLARQWFDVAPGAWFSARAGADDVALLARGLAHAVSELAPDAPRAVEEALTVTADARTQATLAGEELARQLRDASGMWLVVDDYHSLTKSAEAEGLIEAIEASAEIRVLIASRQRPTWATPRRLVYGE